MDAELRKDLIVNRWVLISPRRGKRPHDYKKITEDMRHQAHEQSGPCAFCYGHENETGAELFSIENDRKSPTESPWRVRVVKNKFPAVSLDLDDGKDALCPCDVGVLKGCSLPGFGSHEVVIDTPEHNQVFTSLKVGQIADVLRAYQNRVEFFRNDERFKYCQIFKNNGNAAGATMAHPHSQIIALPVVPKAVEEEVVGSKAYFDKTQKCVFCEVIKSDIVETCNSRLVAVSTEFVAVSPFAARFPYEIWILPRLHNSHFGSASKDEVKDLAEMLKRVLKKLDQALDYPPYNFMVQTAPLRDCTVPFYHWYIRIVPHIISLAGFELGSGCYINPVSPESAAELLRSIKVDMNEDSAREPTRATGGHRRLINMADLETPSPLPIKMTDLAPLSGRLIYMADL